MAKATSGGMPTITVRAPRSRATSAMLRSVLDPKESSTSSAATSMITPRDRPADLLDQVALETDQLGVVERSVDRCDQVGTLRRIDTRAGPESMSAIVLSG